MRPLLLASVASLLLPSAASADLEEALHQPISAGSVARLVGRADEPAVRERWAAALRHEEPSVRAAAARAIFVSGATQLVDDLRQALAREQNPGAAIEEIHALGAFGGKEADADLLAATRRLATDGPSELPLALARVRGQLALEVFLDDLPLHRETLLRWATRGGKVGLSVAGSMALRTGDAARWSAVLGTARQPSAVLDPGMVLAALAARDDAIRAATYLHLAILEANGGQMDPRVSAAVTAALDAERPEDLDARLFLELLGRALGRKAVEQNEWIAAMRSVKGGVRAPAILREPALLAKLLRREIEALSIAVHGNPKTLGKAGFGNRASQRPPDAPTTLATADGFPEGFVSGVLAATGCDPAQAHGVVAAVVTYRGDGRPREVGTTEPGRRGALGASPACHEAGRVLLASALGDVGSEGAQKVLLVILEPAALECLAEGPNTSPTVGAGAACFASRFVGPVEAPKRIKDARPEYPSAAKNKGIQGTVLLSAVISRTGCVRHLELLQGIPALNWESIRAVSKWRYSPASVGGVPVPVQMPISVNYNLR